METAMLTQNTSYTYAYTEAKPAIDHHGGLLCPFCKHEGSIDVGMSMPADMPPLPDPEDGGSTEVRSDTCDTCGTAFRYYIYRNQGYVALRVQQLRITKVSTKGGL